VIAMVNGQKSRGLTAFYGDSATARECAAELTLERQERQPGETEIGFFLHRDVNQPVKMWVTCEAQQAALPRTIRLAINNEEPVDLACTYDGDRTTKSAVHATLLKANRGRDTNTIRVAFSSSEPSLTTIRLHWQSNLEYRRDLLLLAVGVSEYTAPTPILSGALNDAVELVKAFRLQQGLLFPRVRIDPALESLGGAAVNAAASRTNLLARMEWLKKEAKKNPNSLALVTLSGHGGTFDNDPNGSYYYLAHGYNAALPIGQTSVSWHDFLDYFKHMPCPVIVVIDTCHAGAATTRDPNVDPKSELEKAVDEAMRGLANSENGIVLVAACRNDQQALENWGHGALTLAILELLTGNQGDYPTKSSTARLPAEEKRVLTLEDMERYVKDRVEDLVGTGRQAVVLRTSDGLYPRDIPIAAFRPAMALAQPAGNQ
jgi:hypothetical protein